jgi:multiple antibiotic resistance protein
MSFFQSLVLSFIPLFVAIDIMGLLPVFVGMTQDMSPFERRRVVRVACLTATIVALLFIFLGDAILGFLSVSVNDFRIAGGILLLVFAIQDLYVGGKPRRVVSPTLAVVPIGTPLIVGPGVLTTSLLMVQQHKYPATLVSFAINMIIVYVVLRAADPIMRLVGQGVAVAAAKIASLFLAAIGVMMLRVGIIETVRAALPHGAGGP